MSGEEDEISKKLRKGLNEWKAQESIHQLIVILILFLMFFVLISQILINKEHNQEKLKRQLLHKQFLEQTDAYNNKGG